MEDHGFSQEAASAQPWHGGVMGEPGNIAVLKRVIKRKENGKYYAGPNTWVVSIEEAKHFESIREVVSELAEEDLEKGSCVLLLHFPESRYDLELPF